MSSNAIGTVSLGLTAAASWGGADFVGGVASKRASVYAVVIGAESIGLLVLLPLALFTREPFPAMQVWLLGGLAGLCGGFGLTLLYRALAEGKMSIAAPVSALIGAIIPVVVGIYWEGFPDAATICGIILGLIAILLIANQSEEGKAFSFNWKQLSLPVIAGVVFGFFFVLLNMASQNARFWPIIATRIASVFFLILIATFLGKQRMPERGILPLVVLSGVLDTAGNTFFVLAGQIGRMDIAAVLSSLYPAGTVLLAWFILKERAAPIQIFGIVTALLAILLIVI